MFIGRKAELEELQKRYEQEAFQLFILYGRRRVGKTTLLNEFCRDKETIFYSAEQSNDKLNLEKFSRQVFAYYGETALEPFAGWEKALTYIDSRQKGKRLILVFDEFPYLAQKNKALLSVLQHLIDHTLQYGRLFIVLCGSYMGFMEKEVLGSKSPVFGRRTGQLHMRSFDYKTATQFFDGFSDEEKLMLYGAFGGTALYLKLVQRERSFAENIRELFLNVTAYLYEEPLLLLRQEVQEPGIYSAVIEAIASGCSRSNEIAMKTGEEQAKCLKYINTLCELDILYKEDFIWHIGFHVPLLVSVCVQQQDASGDGGAGGRVAAPDRAGLQSLYGACVRKSLPGLSASGEQRGRSAASLHVHRQVVGKRSGGAQAGGDRSGGKGREGLSVRRVQVAQ